MPQKQFVPDDFEPINNSPNGEFVPHDFEPLEMTYAIVNGQKVPLGGDEADIMPQVASPEEPQVNDNSTISKLLKPLVDVSPETRQHMEEFGHATLSDTPASARLKGFASGALTPLLDMIVGQSSPLNLALMGTGAAETTAAKAELPQIEKLLKIPSRVAGGGMMLHGGSKLMQGDQTSGEKLGSGLEMILGLLAAKGPSAQAGDLKLKQFTEQSLPEEPTGNSIEVPEPKIGTPPFNTSQFGLHPTDESNPLLSHVPNRLRPPSTNATVFDALLPERLKLNEQGAATPPTTSVGESKFDVPKLKVEMPKIDLTPDEVKTVSNWKQRAQHFWSDETGAVGKISGLKARDQLSDALDQAMIGREFQDELYSSERARRFARVEKIKTPGFKGLYQKLGAMKGELPKVNFEPLTNLHESTKAMLLREIDRSDLRTGEKLRASVGLGKLLGESDKGAQVPQRGEIELLGKVFGQDFSDRIIQMHSGLPVTKKALNEVANFTKSIMASIDLSAPLRQGLPLIHKGEFWKNLGPMVKMAASPEFYEGTMKAIQERPMFERGEKAGVKFTSLGEDLPNREEAFMSRLAEKIPGVPASERAYTGFLNKLRSDSVDNLFEYADKMGIATPEVDRDIAKFVNNATGRGSLGFLEKNALELNYALFSPRLLSSRLTMLNPVYYAQLSPLARKEALKSLLSVTAAGGIVTSLGAMLGGSIDTDPTSSDFMKVKIGNTRLDPYGGFQQYVVAASKILNQKRTSSISGKSTKFGSSYVAPTTWSTLDDLRRSKMSPIWSFAEDMARGKDQKGKPFSTDRAVIQRVIPLYAQDMYQLAKEDPELSHLLLAIPAGLGMSIQTYDQPQGKTGGQLKPIRPLNQPLRALAPLR